MNLRRRAIALLLPGCWLVLRSTPLPAGQANEAIAKANAAIEAAAPHAQADPIRPIFHVLSPAQWINDPNGPIFYKGYYHLFYQLHPFSDGDGPKYWGHVRSADLAKWEPLPVALWPSTELGEAGVWSGCCTTNSRGQPVIFYTSVATGKSPQTHAEQWAATSDDDLITWQKNPANPILTEELHGPKKIYDWRDPFIFRHKNRAFMVTGGNTNQSKGGGAVVNIYEAQNGDLTQWRYRRVLFEMPDRSATVECPNFFQLGDRWVLFVSPYGKVRYFVGDFDADTCRFKARTQGLVDFGPSFYAPNTLQLADGRRVVWGWVNGFPGGRGWNGCLTIPRRLSLSPDGDLRQSPAPELARLRGKAVKWRDVRLDDDRHAFDLPRTSSLEIQADVDLRSAEGIVVELKSGSKDAPLVLIDSHGGHLTMKDVDAMVPFTSKKKELSLRIFIDRSVLEIFANDAVCATRVITPPDANGTLEIRALGGVAQARAIQAWPMKTIW